LELGAPIHFALFDASSSFPRLTQRQANIRDARGPGIPLEGPISTFHIFLPYLAILVQALVAVNWQSMEPGFGAPGPAAVSG